MDGLAVEIRSYSGEVERHLHDFHQLILPCTGQLDIEIEHHAGRVTGGVAAFVAAGRDHTFVARPQDAVVVLDIPVKATPFPLSPFLAIGRDMQGLIDFLTARGRHARLSPSHSTAWAALMLDCLAQQQGMSDRLELAVRRATAFMQGRLADPIRVTDIARAAGLSPSRLHDAFVRRRATTPHAQLVAMRLDAATRLLAHSSLSIAEIAICTGHADQSTLTRIMRRERHITPAQLRRRLLQGSGENG